MATSPWCTVQPQRGFRGSSFRQPTYFPENKIAGACRQAPGDLPHEAGVNPATYP